MKSRRLRLCHRWLAGWIVRAAVAGETASELEQGRVVAAYPALTRARICSRRLLGEIALQLDLRILHYVFTPRRRRRPHDHNQLPPTPDVSPNTGGRECHLCPVVKVDRRISWHYTILLYFAFALEHDSRGIEIVNFTISLALSAGTLMASAGTPYRLVPAHFYPC